MPSNLVIKRAPFLVLDNFIRSLGLQKGKKGPLEGLEGQRYTLALSRSEELGI